MNNDLRFPFPSGSSGRLLDLRSVFNERAGPRETWFWNRQSGMMPPINTPAYAQASNLYPHLAPQQDTNYRYRPSPSGSGATVIPVVHMVSNTRVDSPSSVGSPAGWVPQQNFTTWPGSHSSAGSEVQSPAGTLRSGYSTTSSGGGGSATPSGSTTGEVARSPTTSTASSKTDTEAEVDALTNLLMQSMEPKLAAGPGQTAPIPAASTSVGPGQGLRKLKDPPGKLGQAVSIPVKTVSTIPGKIGNKSSTLTGSPSSISSSSSNSSLYAAIECFRCHRRLNPNETGQGHIKIGALKTHFHASCFSCYRCSAPLHQDAFFHAHKRLLCPRCVNDALESCIMCDRPITERVIRALGKPYHPTCFTCSVCSTRLDGKPFTVDVHNRIHCLEDFHKRYAPRCASCGLAITPQNGRQETKRVVANDCNYHLECFGMRTAE